MSALYADTLNYSCFLTSGSLIFKANYSESKIEKAESSDSDLEINRNLAKDKKNKSLLPSLRSMGGGCFAAD